MYGLLSPPLLFFPSFFLYLSLPPFLLLLFPFLCLLCFSCLSLALFSILFLFFSP